MGTQEAGLSEDQIRAEIKNIISRITRIDSTEFEDKVLIRDELGIDSLMITEILANCEKFLGVPIDETKLLDIETVGGFLDFAVSLRRKSPSTHDFADAVA